MTNPTLLPARRARRPLAPLALLPALLAALSACDNEQANELSQSGAWHVGRVTATTYRSGQTPTTVTVADPGDLAFEDHASSFNRMVFYADKAVPSRALGHFYSSGATTLPARRYDWFWEADPGPAHRLLMRLDEYKAATFTYDTYAADRETFFYLERDSQGGIGYREDWELTRTH